MASALSSLFSTREDVDDCWAGKEETASEESVQADPCRAGLIRLDGMLS